MAQLNTRIPLELKREGDEVLARYGKSASEAVRRLWAYLAETQKLPDFLCANEERGLSAAAGDLHMVERGPALVQECCRQMGISPAALSRASGKTAPGSPRAHGDGCACARDDLHSELYGSLLDEYEALDA